MEEESNFTLLQRPLPSQHNNFSQLGQAPPHPSPSPSLSYSDHALRMHHRNPCRTSTHRQHIHTALHSTPFEGPSPARKAPRAPLSSPHSGTPSRSSGLDARHGPLSGSTAAKGASRRGTETESTGSSHSTNPIATPMVASMMSQRRSSVLAAPSQCRTYCPRMSRTRLCNPDVHGSRARTRGAPHSPGIHTRRHRNSRSRRGRQ